MNSPIANWNGLCPNGGDLIQKIPKLMKHVLTAVVMFYAPRLWHGMQEIYILAGLLVLCVGITLIAKKLECHVLWEPIEILMELTIHLSGHLGEIIFWFTLALMLFILYLAEEANEGHLVQYFVSDFQTQLMERDIRF